jgi:hypothetical protein
MTILTLAHLRRCAMCKAFEGGNRVFTIGPEVPVNVSRPDELGVGDIYLGVPSDIDLTNSLYNSNPCQLSHLTFLSQPHG